MSCEGLQPFWCYYGGKWRSAGKYPPPMHPTIVEPFAGAAGYALRHYDRDVILVDKDPVIVALWRYLVRVHRSEVLRLPLVGPGQTLDDVHTTEEGKLLIGFWLNKGSAAPARSPSKWMRLGLQGDSWWGPAIRARVAQQVERIRHWRILDGSYETAAAAASRATWFIDPPYIKQGEYYRCPASDLDFERLGRWCRERSGQVIVCEQMGASWLPFRPLGMVKAAKTGASPEAVWTQWNP